MLASEQDARTTIYALTILAVAIRQILRYLEANDRDIHDEIWKKLNIIAVEREDFITGAPEKNELLVVGNKKVIYRIGHRIRAVDVSEIRELP